MIFRRSRHTAAVPENAAPGAADDSRLDDEALDTLVEVLRAYGRFAPPTDERPAERTRELVDGWVKLAALGQPLDGREAIAGPRRWREVATGFADHRRDESTALQLTIGQLRDMVWSFISAVHGAVREDEAEQRVLGAELDTLRQAIERGSTADVRAAAAVALESVTTAIVERRARQQRYVAELGQRLAALGAELDAARLASTLDPLTGLANRKEFDDFLRRLVELHGFVPRPACLLMIDFDDLKALNDAHGHQAGDEALRQVAGCMTRVFLRRYDFVGRYGGDEFAVVLRDTPMSGALARAEQLRESIRGIVLPGTARAATLTLSIGVAELVKGESVAEWLRRADRALYTAKESGRDRVIEAPEIFR